MFEFVKSLLEMRSDPVLRECASAVERNEPMSEEDDLVLAAIHASDIRSVSVDSHWREFFYDDYYIQVTRVSFTCIVSVMHESKELAHSSHQDVISAIQKKYQEYEDARKAQSHAELREILKGYGVKN